MTFTQDENMHRILVEEQFSPGNKVRHLLQFATFNNENSPILCVFKESYHLIGILNEKRLVINGKRGLLW